MKSSLLIFAFFFLLFLGNINAQKVENIKPFSQNNFKGEKAFVENKGQFPDIDERKVLFTNFDNAEEFYFTSQGIIIKLDTVLYKKPWAKKVLDIFDKEKEVEREYYKETSYYLYAEWQNTNPDVKIETSEKTEGYYTFGLHKDICNSYKKITYKNIYPNIDIEYTIPNDSAGIKYNLILHPGADVSDISLKYSGDVNEMLTDNNGNIIIKTPLHNIVEHTPKSYYSDASGDVASSYILNDNIITFFVSNTSQDKTIIIDPWIAGITGYTDAYGYDVEYDWSGNLYVYYNDINASVPTNFGLYVRKFSPTGALLWTHTVTTQIMYEGNFMLDKLANKIYISEGFNGSGATAYRINASNGVADGFVSQQNGSFREMWDMAFDCNLNRIIGVGGGTNSNLNGGLINPNTGAVTIANFTGTAPTDQDIACQAVDGQGNLFVVYAFAQYYMDHWISLINSTLNGNVWQVNHGMYGFNECMNHAPYFSCSGPGSNAFNGLDVNNNYLYYYDGAGLATYNKATGAQIAATSVSWSGQFYTPRNQGGIAVDDCDNIYIGGPNSNILMYHFNGSAFTQLGNMPLGWTGNHSVFDIKLDKNTNLLYVSGHSNVGVFNATQSGSCVNNSITNTSLCTGPQTGTGTVTIVTTLSNPIITYIWYDSNGNIISTTSNSTSLTNSVPGLTNGTYTVHAQINPACGPVLIITVVIFCPTCSAIITPTPVSCYGGNNGSAIVTPTGGIPPYTYVWSPTPGSGQGTPNVSGYSAGSISVTVTDGNNCVATATATITQPAAVTAVITNTSVLCNGGNTGTASATASGGTPNYSYNWTPAPGTGQGTANVGGLSNGTYNLTVTDSHGCTGTSSTVITQPPALSVSINHTNVTCNGGSNGTATATASGGTPNYTYNWSPTPGSGQGTSNPTGLTAQTYSLTVTDNNGCSVIQSVIITQPPVLVITATANPASICPGGSSTLTASGASTYVWSPATSLSSSTGTTVTATPTFPTTYSVTGTDVNGCTATTTVSVAIYTPPVATFTAQTPICAGDPASIVYLGTPGTTLTWNLNGATILSGTPSNGLPFTITWNTANTYAITLQVTDINGCVSNLEIHYIQVVGAGTPSCCTFPTPDAGPDLQFCGLSGNLQATTPDDPSYVGTWSQVSGPGISSYINSHLINTNVTVTLAGTYQYQWLEANGPCDSADFVSVIFIQQPIANGGPDTSICGLTYNMSATLSTPGSGTWTGIGIGNPSSPTSNVTVVAYGTYTYAWTETNVGCNSTDSVTIEFLQVPNADAGIDGIGCGFNYTLSADSAFPGYWTGPSGVIYLDGYTLPTTGVLIPNYTGSSYTATFTWHANNGPCTDNDAVNVTFIRPPHAEAGPNQSICGPLSQVLADTIGSGLVSGYWTVSPTGPILTPFFPYGATVDISILGNNAYNNQSVGEYWLTFVAQNGQSCSGRDSLLISFYDVPVANAGGDDSICGKSYNLNAVWTIDNPVGYWSTISGPGTANFIDPNNDTTDVTVTQYGTYQFEWKESNALSTLCSDRDTITIEFLTVPEPDAGLDFRVCGKFAYICASPTVPGGQWSCPTGGIAYYDAPIDSISHNVASYQDSACTWIRYSSENDTVTMYWSEFNGVCYGYDSVNVFFKYIPPAIELVNPTDTFVCGPTFYNLNAQDPTSNCYSCSGYWIDTVMNTTFSFSPNSTNTNPNATIDTGGTSYYGWHTFYWVTTNGQCGDTSEAVNVLFIENPVANAGFNYWPGLFGPNHEIKTDTVCGLSWQMGAIPSIGTGQWYSQGLNVHFDSLTGPPTTPVYNDSLYLSCSGCYTVFNTVGDKYREFIWQENNNGCYDSDTIRLYFAPNPSGMFTTTMPQCLHDSSMIIAHTYSSPNEVDYGIINFAWQYPGGVLDSSIANPNNSDTIYVSWATGTQHNVTLITTNQWLICQSGIVNHTIIEPAPFMPSYNLIEASCGNCNGEVELSPDRDTILTNYYTFNWVDSMFNNSSSFTQTGLCPLVNYNVVVNGQSLSPDAYPDSYCHDSILIHMPDTGYVTAQFDTLTLEQNQAAPYNVQFINTSIGGRKYSWRIYNEAGELLYTSTLESPNYVFDDEGCYQIVLVATSKWQCKDTTIFNPLCVDAYPVLDVPNAFTPNGDGQNDYFRVHSKSILEFHAVILNRWGKKLYEWDDANGYWDGKIGGSEAAPGVYYYVVTAKGKKETDFEFKGFFYLLREK